MKETGLMFKAPLVRAILEGHKTQTRRVVKGVKHFPDWGSAVGMVGGAWLYGSPAALGLAERGDRWSVTLDDDHIKRMCTREAYGWGAGAGCPMGLPGDRIYVREAHAHHPQFAQMAFRADGEEFEDADGFLWEPKWTPAIHMKKEDARIWLEITGVRVEHLQQITEADAKAEGVQPWPCDHPRRSCADIGCNGPDYLAGFRHIWESTGGDWNADPWVWVIDFKTISTNGRPA